MRQTIEGLSKSLRVGSTIGQGGFGKVTVGTWEGKYLFAIKYRVDIFASILLVPIKFIFEHHRERGFSQRKNYYT